MIRSTESVFNALGWGAGRDGSAHAAVRSGSAVRQHLWPLLGERPQRLGRRVVDHNVTKNSCILQSNKFACAIRTCLNRSELA